MNILNVASKDRGILLCSSVELGYGFLCIWILPIAINTIFLIDFENGINPYALKSTLIVPIH